MKTRDRELAARLEEALTDFAAKEHPLPGISGPGRRDVLIRQLIDSLHRVEYPRRLLERRHSPRRADPGDVQFFDPIRAAAYQRAEGHHDEACWLVFLFVHLGARPAGDWRFIREIYGGLGGGIWNWERVEADPGAFGKWLEEHSRELNRPGVGRGFGNHRKYESLAHTGRTVQSYVAWVGPSGHNALFKRAQSEAAKRRPQIHRETFDILYNSMNAVWRFGRLAKFDYLSMIGKLDLAAIEPGFTYIQGATGPVAGARLLFAGDKNAAWPSGRLEELLCNLEGALGVGMQALEDAICNWQKGPDTFISFRG